MTAIIKDHHPKAKIYLFQTWAREATHKIYNDNFSGGPKQMFEELRASYHEAAEKLDATLIPCGDAWELSIQTRPSLNLYAKDRYHATTTGSYLNALVIYAVMNDADPRGLPPLATLTEEQATYLQEIAWKTLHKD